MAYTMKVRSAVSATRQPAPWSAKLGGQTSALRHSAVTRLNPSPRHPVIRGRELSVHASGMSDVVSYGAEFSIVMWVRISGVVGPTAIGQRTSGKTATENVSRR